MDAWSDKEPVYTVLPDGGFVIDEYNLARPFSSFFPGIAGLYGIPLWAFYVNRGQAISSFGISGKDGAIMEFYPANKAYQTVSRYGFRTFVKFQRDSDFIFYEPFQSGIASRAQAVKQRMTIRPYELEIEEVNKTLGMKISVVYFTLPGERLPALVRVVSIRNLSNSRPMSLEVLDGMPVILPYGLNQFIVKNMFRTAEAWMQARHIDDFLGFYKVRVELDDRPEVVKVEKGNFYFSYALSKGKTNALRIISDPDTIFGSVLDFDYPEEFLEDKRFLYPDEQMLQNKLPCAFSFQRVKIPPSGEAEFVTLIGHASGEREASRFARLALSSSEYILNKRIENRNLVSGIMDEVFTVSSFVEFDKYTAQSYLDNLLRGGYPIKLPTLNGHHIFYVYGRKHGDLERDYNNFNLEPTFLSQGNGNYRDMNQNRRLDVFFHPEVGDSNVKLFMNLLRLDGYNPLQINGVRFVLRQGPAELEKWLSGFVNAKALPVLRDFLVRTEFSPGQLFSFIKEKNIKIRGGEERFLKRLLSECERIEDAEHREGFWTDHWTYNIDLIESYLAVFPDEEKRLFFEDKTYTFFDSEYYVARRDEKFVLTKNGVRQYKAVRKDKDKSKLISERPQYKNKVRTLYGKGDVYYTSLFVKLLTLLAAKVMNLDPYGVGIEMEADKPNWYDSLNGLPGLIGSSSSETMEVLRLIRFLKDLVLRYKGFFPSVNLPEEIASLIDEQINKLFDKELGMEYWQEEGKLREAYREKVFWGLSGKENSLALDDLLVYLETAEKIFLKAIERAIDKKSGLVNTYFYYIAEEWEEIEGKTHVSGQPAVRVTRFSQHILPWFLEGQVHYLRILNDKDKARKLYDAVKKSPLFDQELEMYKVCASLKNESLEIGRSAVFTPGWLENESIWLHMEYKYLLELLKSDIGKPFFSDILKTVICFQRPEVYGRSILENSSFIVSSAFPDESQWGRGFVARLTGSTVEWIHVWMLMCVGDKFFWVDENGQLVFEFSPKLPEWLFTSESRKVPARGALPANSFAFQLFGKTLVVYKNPKRYNCYSDGVGVMRIEVISNQEGKVFSVEGNRLEGQLAYLLRSGGIREIICEIGKK